VRTGPVRAAPVRPGPEAQQGGERHGQARECHEGDEEQTGTVLREHVRPRMGRGRGIAGDDGGRDGQDHGGADLTGRLHDPGGQPLFVVADPGGGLDVDRRKPRAKPTPSRITLGRIAVT
jgi:hypothetical protein